MGIDKENIRNAIGAFFELATKDRIRSKELEFKDRIRSKELEFEQKISSMKDQIHEKEIAKEAEFGLKISSMKDQIHAKEIEKEAEFGRKYAVIIADLKLAEHEKMLARGLVNSRGVLEWALKILHRELYPTKRFIATSVAQEVGKCLVSLSTSPLVLEENSDAKRIYEILLSCNISSEQALAKLYTNLSEEIHGLSWSGTAVNIYSSYMSKEHMCVIRRIAEELLHFDSNIKITNPNDPSSSYSSSSSEP
jgi:hypothetical protein